MSGNYARALELANASLGKNDRHLSTLRVKIAALHYLDRAEDARAAAAVLMQKQPDFSVAGYLNNHPAAAFGSARAVSAALQASGIP